MEMKGDRIIPASRQTVWDGLNDAEILKAALPGCEALEKTDDINFVATVLAKVGPVKTRFNGAVQLSELNPPQSYMISGEGKGGAAGFAKGSARVFLEEISPNETKISYEVNATIGGKLAQVGQRLIDTVAMKMADDFFDQFATLVAGPVTPSPAPTSDAIGTLPEEQADRPKLDSGNKTLITIGLGIAIVLIGLFLLF